MKDGKKVVLHVEDEPSIKEVYKIILEKEGFIILSASNLKEGWLTYQKNFLIIDAILLDGNLPDGKSISLVRQIREFGFVGKIIANSGEDKTNDELISAGCNIAFQKPTLFFDLIKILK